MDEPFLKPDRLQRAGRHFRDEAEDVRTPEGAKSILCRGVDIRIAGIQGRQDRWAHKDQTGVQVGLVESVKVDIGRQVAEIPDMELGSARDRSTSRYRAILSGEPIGEG